MASSTGAIIYWSQLKQVFFHRTVAHTLIGIFIEESPECWMGPTARVFWLPLYVGNRSQELNNNDVMIW
jgi:hypothetical protein